MDRLVQVIESSKDLHQKLSKGEKAGYQKLVSEH